MRRTAVVTASAFDAARLVDFVYMTGFDAVFRTFLYTGPARNAGSSDQVSCVLGQICTHLYRILILTVCGLHLRRQPLLQS